MLKDKMKIEEIMKILDEHERRLALLEGKKIAKAEKTGEGKTKISYKKGGTTEKIISLNDENFFHQPRTINQIIDKLKEKDYHFKASDITLPLRNIVRNGVLRKTKLLDDGTKSKKWVYLYNENK